MYSIAGKKISPVVSIASLGMHSILLMAQNIFTKVTSLIATASEDRANNLVKHYTHILTYLTTAGAFLSSVKPEYLLSLDDFKAYIQRKFDLKVLIKNAESMGGKITDF